MSSRPLAQGLNPDRFFFVVEQKNSIPLVPLHRDGEFSGMESNLFAELVVCVIPCVSRRKVSSSCLFQKLSRRVQCVTYHKIDLFLNCVDKDSFHNEIIL